MYLDLKDSCFWLTPRFRATFGVHVKIESVGSFLIHERILDNQVNFGPSIHKICLEWWVEGGGRLRFVGLVIINLAGALSAKKVVEFIIRVSISKIPRLLQVYSSSCQRIRVQDRCGQRLACRIYSKLFCAYKVVLRPTRVGVYPYVNCHFPLVFYKDIKLASQWIEYEPIVHHFLICNPCELPQLILCPCAIWAWSLARVSRIVISACKHVSIRIRAGRL